MLYRHRVDREKCNGCGLCTGVCPRGAIVTEYAPIKDANVAVITDKCAGCGKCIPICGNMAIYRADNEIKEMKTKRERLLDYFENRRPSCKHLLFWLNIGATLPSERHYYYFNNCNLPIDEAVAMVYLNACKRRGEQLDDEDISTSQIMFSTEGLHYHEKNNPREFTPYESIIGAFSSLGRIALEIEDDGRRSLKFIRMGYGDSAQEIVRIINQALEAVSKGNEEARKDLFDFKTLLIAHEEKGGGRAFLPIETHRTTWIVFTDGTCEAAKENTWSTCAKLDEELLSELKYLLNTQPWGDLVTRINPGNWPESSSHFSSTDVSAWEMEYFDGKGNVIDYTREMMGTKDLKPIFDILYESINHETHSKKCRHSVEEKFRGYINGYNIAYEELVNSGKTSLAEKKRTDELLDYVAHFVKSIKHSPRVSVRGGGAVINENREKFRKILNRGMCCERPCEKSCIVEEWPLVVPLHMFDEAWMITVFGYDEFEMAVDNIFELKYRNRTRCMVSASEVRKLSAKINSERRKTAELQGVDERRYKAALFALAGPCRDDLIGNENEDEWESIIETVRFMKEADESIKSLTGQIGAKYARVSELFKTLMPCAGSDYTKLTDKERCDIIDLIENACSLAELLNKKADCKAHTGVEYFSEIEIYD